jgi:hypothetical protein
MSDTVHACPRTQCITQPTHTSTLRGREKDGGREAGPKHQGKGETNQAQHIKITGHAGQAAKLRLTARLSSSSCASWGGRRKKQRRGWRGGGGGICSSVRWRRRHLQLGTMEAIEVRHANAKAPHPRTTHLLLTPATHLLRKVTQHIVGTSQRFERKPRGKEGP